VSVDEGLILGLSLLKDFLKEELDTERIDAGYIDVKDKRFKKLSLDDLKKMTKV